MYALDARPRWVDRISTGGMAVDGDRLVRVLHAGGTGGTELLVHDLRGIQRYLRVDAALDGHDVAWQGTELLVVATGLNSVLRLSGGGEVLDEWCAEGVRDAWHLNCLSFDAGRPCVSAFGRFTHHRDWAGSARRGTGIVFDMERGKPVLDGLTTPHQARLVDGRWLVCESEPGRLMSIDAARPDRRHAVELGGWTRGLALADEHILVGVSAPRADRGGFGPPRARVVVLDRARLERLEELDVPAQEIYDLVLADPLVVDAIEQGFTTNPLRVAEQAQLARFLEVGIEPVELWASGTPLPSTACRVALTASVPGRLVRDRIVDVPCRVTNRGGAILTSYPPNPVRLSYRWCRAEAASEPGSTIEHDSLRTPLPAPLAPGSDLEISMAVQAPSQPGRYELVLTLVQEMVAWFDDLDSSNAARSPVTVT